MTSYTYNNLVITLIDNKDELVISILDNKMFKAYQEVYNSVSADRYNLTVSNFSKLINQALQNIDNKKSTCYADNIYSDNKHINIDITFTNIIDIKFSLKISFKEEAAMNIERKKILALEDKINAMESNMCLLMNLCHVPIYYGGTLDKICHFILNPTQITFTHSHDFTLDKSMYSDNNITIYLGNINPQKLYSLHNNFNVISPKIVIVDQMCCYSNTAFDNNGVMTINNFPRTPVLEIRNAGLHTLSDISKRLPFLKELIISQCPNFTALPLEVLNMKGLKITIKNCPKFIKSHDMLSKNIIFE